MGERARRLLFLASRRLLPATRCAEPRGAEAPSLSRARGRAARLAPRRSQRRASPSTNQGGKQAGGWLYGSNDALCSAVSDKHAYSKTCGHGKWGDGAVVAVFLDMDAHKVRLCVLCVSVCLPLAGRGCLVVAVFLDMDARKVRAPCGCVVQRRALACGTAWVVGVPIEPWMRARRAPPAHGF